MSTCPRCGGYRISPLDKDTSLCGHCGAHIVIKVSKDAPKLREIDYCDT